MAKQFFYLCAGLLMLALAFHLGAKSVVAQGTMVTGPGIDANGSGPAVSAVVNGYFKTMYAGGSFPTGEVGTLPEQVPGGSPIIASSASSGYVILAQDGSVYRWDGTWVLLGNLAGMPTSALPRSWGSIKVQPR